MLDFTVAVDGERAQSNSYLNLFNYCKTLVPLFKRVSSLMKYCEIKIIK